MKMRYLSPRSWLCFAATALTTAGGCATVDNDFELGSGGNAPLGGVAAVGASPATGGVGATPATGGEGATPATGGVGATPATGGAGATPATGGAGATPTTGGVGAAPTTGGVGAAPATGGVGAAPATGGATPGTGGGSSGAWDIGSACDNTQQPACGDTDMWCEASACTCGTGSYCAETGACYWEGSTCP